MMETLYLGMTASEIRALQEKVASADVLVEALREITYSHDGYARKKAEQALATYDKLSEVKHDTSDLLKS